MNKLGPAVRNALRDDGSWARGDGPLCDAVIVGSGATGCLAARLLTDAGLSVLLLDAGRKATRLRTWFRRLAALTAQRMGASTSWDALLRWRQPVQSLCYAWRDDPLGFIDDVSNPYVVSESRPFVWFRSRQLGGRMTVSRHGRQYYRFGPDDFGKTAASGSPWPISYEDLEPWYTLAEEIVSVSGMYDHLRCIPDSNLANVEQLTAVERQMCESIRARWPHSQPVLGRNGIGVLSALEDAAASGCLRIRADAIMREITVDKCGHVSGVVCVDRRRRQLLMIRSRMVFLCASTLESTRILLLSRSCDGNGFSAASGALGHYLMDHIRVRAQGSGPPSIDSMNKSSRCVYVPRFDARNDPLPAKHGGFGVQLYHTIGDQGHSGFTAASFGSMLPRSANRVWLHPSKKDAWGIPVLQIECDHGLEDSLHAGVQRSALTELLAAVGAGNVNVESAPAPPGSANHECGTARMGTDPGTSVLDPNNECWGAKGLYVTDGACFPSQPPQNPTLTLLALTGRACRHALGTIGVTSPMINRRQKLLKAI